MKKLVKLRRFKTLRLENAYKTRRGRNSEDRMFPASVYCPTVVLFGFYENTKRHILSEDSQLGGQGQGLYSE
jgi:hypothetical protein